MAIKAQKVEGRPERAVVTACCVNKIVLAQVAARWTPNALPSKWANVVVGWCVDHFRQYKKPPGADLGQLFDAWKGRADPQEAELVGRFLQELSDDYVRRAEEVTPEFALDTAARLMLRVQVVEAAARAQLALENGEVDRAAEELQGFKPVQLGSRGWVDTGDSETVAEIIALARANREKPLIEYGGALEFLLGAAMKRGRFVAFAGYEKGNKCVVGDTEVFLADGRLVRIDHLVNTQMPAEVVAFDERSRRFVTARIEQFHDNGDLECFEVVTRTGRTVVATANHPFLAPGGWRSLDQLVVGDYVAAPRRASWFGTARMDDDEVRLLAYLMADGGTTGYSPTFTKSDPVLVADFTAACTALGFGLCWNGICASVSGATEFSSRMGLKGHKSKEKTVPPCVFAAPRDQVASFLRVFFSCDGHILKDGSRIILNLASRRLIEQLRHLLVRFGICSVVKYQQARIGTKVYDAWNLAIKSARDVSTFLGEIGLMSYKSHTPKEVTRDKSFLDKLPPEVATSLLAELTEELGSGALSRLMGPKLAAVRSQLKRRLPIMKCSFAPVALTRSGRKWLDSDVLWDEVVSIRAVGVRHVYDIGVPGLHNFVGNDVVLHNSFWLQDTACRAFEQGRNVAYFEAGDSTREEVLDRLSVRLARRPLPSPLMPKKIKVPTAIYPAPPAPNDGPGHKRGSPDVIFYDYVPKLLTDARAVEALRGPKGAGKLRVSAYPSGTLSVAQIEAQIEEWRNEGWAPDVVALDYADLLAPANVRAEPRDQINANWRALRSVSQKFAALVVTATQVRREAYSSWLIKKEHMADDKRKLAEVTALIGINRTAKEIKDQVWRLNLVVGREIPLTEDQVVYTSGCLWIGAPGVVSVF